MKLPEPTYSVSDTNGDHKYFITTSMGERIGPLRGVTSIVGILDKPALINWAARMAADYFKAELLRIGKAALNVDALEDIAKEAYSAHRRKATAAKDLGTACHDLFEAILKNEEPRDMPDELIEPARDFKRWRLSTDIEIVATELPVASRNYRYAGRIDAVGYSARRGGFGLVDYKTSSGFYGNEFAYQCSGYCMALQEQYGIPVGWAEIIRFGKVPPYESEGRPVVDLLNAGEGFLSLLKAERTLKMPLIGAPTFSTSKDRAQESPKAQNKKERAGLGF